MIQIKLLKIKGVEPIGVDNLELFINGINNVLEKKIEIVEKIDSEFKGYYILPMGFTVPEDGNGLVRENINEKVFLLSVINSSIPQYIEEFKPAGLTNWRFFKDAGTTIDARKDALISQNINKDDYVEFNRDYVWYRPYKADGTYETVAKSILSYLELYDRYLKNK